MDSNLKALETYEIPYIIEKASLFGGRIVQPTPDANLTTLITRIDVDSYGMMFIRFSEEFAVEKERPVTVRLNYRNVSFLLDSKQYSIEGNVIVSQLPREAKAIAIRPNERYAMPLNSKVSSTIYRIEKRGGSVELNSHVVDVSTMGLGLIIHNSEEGVLLKNDHIWIRNINGRMLEEPIFGRIVYAHTRKFKDGSIDTKVGVSLESAIPENIFYELQNLSRVILTA